MIKPHHVEEEEDSLEHFMLLGKVAFDMIMVKSFLRNSHREHWISKH